MTSREIIKLLEAEGYVWVRASGSHHRYVQPQSGRRVTIVHPDKEVKIGTLIAYEKQSGVRLRRR